MPDTALPPSPPAAPAMSRQGVHLSWPTFVGLLVLSLLGLAFAGALLARTAAAELVVIHDNGRGTDAAPYYEAFRDERPPQPAVAVPAVPAHLDGDLSARLPVHTPELRPGRVVARATDYPNLTQPFFLVGADPLSRRWLQQNRSRLSELGAMGLVIEAASAADFAQLQALAGDLPLAPVAGSAMATLLQISHYPVLITRTGIDQ